MSEHTHAVNAAASGISALPGVAAPFACTQAMWRFLHNEAVPFAALVGPIHEAVRPAVAASASPFALVVHDWCMFGYPSHASKKDRYRHSHDKDLGYELGSALVVDAADGRPLGPMELRLRTADRLLSTRVPPLEIPRGHADELLDVMEESRRWDLGKTPVHVIDREADSVGHYRAWAAKGHTFLVRADDDRLVLWRGEERRVRRVVEALAPDFRDVPAAEGGPTTVAVRGGAGHLRVAQTDVTLHRPARTNTGATTARGHAKKVDVPGDPLTLRLVVTRVVDDAGAVLAEWLLLTNADAAVAAATVGQWYAWRWRIETYHKLLKTAGLNAEAWQQETGDAVLRRLCVASMACLTVWHLRRDDRPAAAHIRRVLVRLSGRQMAHRVESTAPALLAGLEKLLALDDLLRTENLAEILALARHVLPHLFPRHDPPAKMCR